LLPLIALEKRPLPPELADRVHFVRASLFDRLAERQAHWWSWTPHGAMRLAKARILLGANPPHAAQLPQGAVRAYDGAIRYPDAPALTWTPAQ
jgi:hypothetical protein